MPVVRCFHLLTCDFLKHVPCPKGETRFKLPELCLWNISVKVELVFLTTFCGSAETFSSFLLRNLYLFIKNISLHREFLKRGDFFHSAKEVPTDNGNKKKREEEEEEEISGMIHRKRINAYT